MLALTATIGIMRAAAKLREGMALPEDVPDSLDGQPVPEKRALGLSQAATWPRSRSITDAWCASTR